MPSYAIENRRRLRDSDVMIATMHCTTRPYDAGKPATRSACSSPSDAIVALAHRKCSITVLVAVSDLPLWLKDVVALRANATSVHSAIRRVSCCTIALLAARDRSHGFSLKSIDFIPAAPAALMVNDPP
jgi:hypothetical protein